MFVPLMLIVALFATFIISNPWLTLGTMVAAYAVSIPFGVLFFLSAKRAYEQNHR